LCRAYIISGACKRVVIVQMQDREGFAELLRNLEGFELAYTITEVPQKLYDVAQQIGCVQGSCHTSNIDTSSEITHGNAGAVKTFVFDNDLLKNIPRSCGDDARKEESHGPSRNGNRHSRSEPARGLLRTGKENFVILTVGCMLNDCDAVVR
jgi:hypothetical protein